MTNERRNIIKQGTDVIYHAKWLMSVVKCVIY